MEFRSLKKQYIRMKQEIDRSVQEVMESANFISGHQVEELERVLAAYVGQKNCITCANGTDALTLAMMVWKIGPGDAVFVPDLTFFSSGEIVSYAGATPVFVDVDGDTFNMDAAKLEEAVQAVLKQGELTPKVIITVDLYGLSADYQAIRKIAEKYDLYILEDSAQGFGGSQNGKRNCAFGDISTTSFFPMKPLGCYGDGGAVFTDHDEWAELIRSYRVHGKGRMKYDNVRIGMNSRLDTIQASVLLAKLPYFCNEELKAVREAADRYEELLCDFVKTPKVPDGCHSSWAQYTIQLENREERDGVQKYLKDREIPTFVYYPKPMHLQTAFDDNQFLFPGQDWHVTEHLCDVCLSIPMSPYIEEHEQKMVAKGICEYLSNAYREGK